jgi:hypothetical protein
MKRIFWIITGVVVLVLAVAFFKHRSTRRAMESGDITVHEQPGANATPDAASADQQTQTEQPAAPGRQGTQTGSQSGSAAPTPPASDSIPRNPPNGMLFAGSGKYQLYRQGDITWRLNTDTGEACILFATDAEWSKPRVYQHGCGPN